MCKSNIEKASVLYLFSYFYTIKMQDYEEAKKLIVEADELDPSNIVILMQKARILTYLGEYPQAEGIFKSICFTSINSDKLQNQYISWFADLYRRMAETVDFRDSVRKLSLYEKSMMQYEFLTNIDNKTLRGLLKVLSDLSYMYYYKEAMDFLEKKVIQYYDLLLDSSQYTSNFSGVYKNLVTNNQFVSDNLLNLVKKISIKYKQYALSITDLKQGMIVKKQGAYGFIANKHSSHYFNMTSIRYSEPAVGDTVEFVVLESLKGKIALEVNLIKRFDV
jgi:tetratricopeptide (TPR) repeat protein